MGKRDRVTFRYSGAVVAAATFGLLGALPFALSSWYLAPVLIVPFTLGLWATRAGVDVTPAGLVVRSALASRRLRWEDVDGFTAVNRRVYADVVGGGAVALPAVRPADVPRLMRAGGQQFDAGNDTQENGATLTS